MPFKMVKEKNKNGKKSAEHEEKAGVPYERR